MRSNARHLTDSELIAFVDHELPPARQEEADTHLAACSECRARRTGIDRAAADAALACQAEDAQPPHPLDSRTRLQARMRSTAADGDVSWGFQLFSRAVRTPRWLQAGVALAMIVLLVRAAPFG